MSEDSILKCLIAFVLGYLIARMIRGDGLMVGGNKKKKSQLLNYGLGNRFLKIEKSIILRGVYHGHVIHHKDRFPKW